MNLNELSNEEFFKLIDSLKPYRKDELYRYLWVNHVKEDVRTVLEEDVRTVLEEDVRAILEEYDVPYLSDDDFDALIDDCANRFVYNGEYDCNTDYWSNLEALIDHRLYLFEQKHK